MYEYPSYGAHIIHHQQRRCIYKVMAYHYSFAVPKQSICITPDPRASSICLFRMLDEAYAFKKIVTYS